MNNQKFTFQVKTDVIAELRNEIYYNQQDIIRLMTNDSPENYKEVIDRVKSLLKENVVAGNAIDLLESILPAPQPQQPAAPSTVEEQSNQSNDVSGITEVK